MAFLPGYFVVYPNPLLGRSPVRALPAKAAIRTIPAKAAIRTIPARGLLDGCRARGAVVLDSTMGARVRNWGMATVTFRVSVSSCETVGNMAKS